MHESVGAVSDSQSSPAKPPFDQVMQVLRQVLSGEAPAPGQPQGRAWVVGEDSDGMTVVAVEVNDTVYHIKVPDLQSLAAMVGPSLKPRRALEDVLVPYKTITGPSLSVVAHGVTPGEQVTLVRAGPSAQDMTAIDSIEGDSAELSCFTFRGPTQEKQGIEYKPFNEDGLLVWLRRGDAANNLTEYALVATFDQAGGEGSVANRHGAASEAAALAFASVLPRLVAQENVETVMRAAVQKAHNDIVALKVGAVSTLAVALLETTFEQGKVTTQKVWTVTLGDSRVLWVGSDGSVKGKTALHNLGSQVAAGLIEDIPPAMALRFAGALSKGLGTEDIMADVSVWNVSSGDFLVVETDGIGDAHEMEEAPPGAWHADRCVEAQARLLSQAPSSAQAVETLLGYALDQVASHYGKPDNIGVAVMKIR